MDIFRRARPADPSWNLAKTAVQVAVFWGVILFVIPPWIVAASTRLGLPVYEFAAARFVAVGLFVVASTLGIVSAITMAVQGQGTPLPIDSPRRMVVTGPYARVRNPMAIAGLAQGTAVAIWHGSLAVLVYVIVGGVIWQFAVRPLEEADLLRVFGDEFARYRETVPLWWPRRL